MSARFGTDHTRCFAEDLISATADKLISTSEAELCDDGHCTVPAGSTWIFDQSIDVKRLAGKQLRCSSKMTC